MSYKEKLKIAIVEDEEQAIETLSSYLDRFFSQLNQAFTLSVYRTAEHFKSRVENDFDILFADIALPDGNGWELVKELRQTNKNITVIFVTNMLQYAVKGYEVRAFDFMVKPVSYYDFALKLDGALEHVINKAEEEIWISGKSFQIKVKVSDIRYIETERHYLIFHIKDQVRSVYGALDNIRKQLKHGFALCNRCYLVNLACVTAIEDEYVVLGNERLLISRNKRKSFLNELNDYIISGGNTGD